MKSDNFERVVQQYAACESVKETARAIGVSQYAVSRALISRNIPFSPKAKDVIALRKAGCSDEEIRVRLNITKKAMSKYMLYTKCSYVFDQKTENALRIIRCRSRKG